MVTLKTGIGDMKIPDRQTSQSWSVQVGAFTTEEQARTHLDTISKMANAANAIKAVSPTENRGKTFHRARLTGLSSRQAQSICGKLSALNNACLVIAPSR